MGSWGHGGYAARDLFLDGCRHIRVLPQDLFAVLAPLTQPNLARLEPRPALLDDAHLQADIDQAAFARDALVEHDVELGHPEGWGDLVLDDLDLRPAAHRLCAHFDRVDLANIQAHGRVEL